MKTIELSNSELFELLTQPSPSFDMVNRQNIIQQLQKFIHDKESALQNAPEGKLVVLKKGDNRVAPQYFLQTADKRTYVSADRISEVRAYAQRDYDQRQLKEAKRLLHYLERLSPEMFTFHESYDALRPERQELVEPDFLSEQCVRDLWSHLSYDSMGFAPNYPEYYTSSNIRVRSISERNIGTRLEEQNVLYLYEFPLKLDDGGVIYPDFTCLNMRTRRLYLWEHFGKLDDKKYLENNARKLERYRKSGYYSGISLILSYDSNGNLLTQKEIDGFIQAFLL